MSGWTDLDGSGVMAGSPGILGCFDIALGGVLGQYKPPYGQMMLKQLREICARYKHHVLVERCDLAEQLITAARCLFDRPVGMDDPIDVIREIDSALAIAVGKDERLKD